MTNDIQNSSSLRKSKNVIMAQPDGEVSLIDNKLFNFLLNTAYPDLKRKDRHQVPVKDVLRYLGHSSATRMLESLENLKNLSVTLEYVDKEGDVRQAGCHFLSYDATKSEDGVLVFAFDPILLEFAHDPKVYATLSPATVRRFRSKHAELLYEIVAIYRRMQNNIWRPTIDEFRKALHIPQERYAGRFDHFKNKIIEKAVKEINELAEFGVEVEYIKAGRGGRVHQLEFRTFEFVDAQRDRRPLKTKKASGKRDTRTVDLLDGRTDEERDNSTVLRPETIEECAQQLDNPDEINSYIDTWYQDVSGRQVKDPDGSFRLWLTACLEQERGDDVFGEIETDSISSILEAWDED